MCLQTLIDAVSTRRPHKQRPGLTTTTCSIINYVPLCGLIVRASRARGARDPHPPTRIGAESFEGTCSWNLHDCLRDHRLCAAAVATVGDDAVASTAATAWQRRSCLGKRVEIRLLLMSPVEDVERDFGMDWVMKCCSISMTKQRRVTFQRSDFRRSHMMSGRMHRVCSTCVVGFVIEHVSGHARGCRQCRRCSLLHTGCCH